MPVRVQLSRAKGWRMPPGTVKVDRSTRFGNPFRCDDPAAAVNQFRRACALGGFWPAGRRFQGGAIVTVAEIRRELAGKNLACWCEPGAPCHADPLLDIANGGEA